VDRRASLQMLA